MHPIHPVPGQPPQKTTPTPSSAGAQRCCAHPWGGWVVEKNPFPKSRPLAWSYDDIFQIILPTKQGYALFSNKGGGGGKMNRQVVTIDVVEKTIWMLWYTVEIYKFIFLNKHRCVGTSDFGLRWLSRPSQWCYHVKLHHHGQALRPRFHRPFPWHLWSRCRKHRCNPKRGHLEVCSMDWVRKMLHNMDETYKSWNIFVEHEY